MQVRSRIVAREVKSEDRFDLYAGTPPMEALRAVISMAASHKQIFSVMHIDVLRTYFRARAQELVLVRLQWRTDSAPTLIIGLLKKYVRHTGRSKQQEACLARGHQQLGTSAGTQLEEPFSS